MAIHIDWNGSTVVFSWSGVRGEVAPPIRFAHLGCKLLHSTLVARVKPEDVPDDVRRIEVRRGGFPETDALRRTSTRACELPGSSVAGAIAWGP